MVPPRFGSIRRWGRSASSSRKWVGLWSRQSRRWSTRTGAAHSRRKTRRREKPSEYSGPQSAALFEPGLPACLGASAYFPSGLVFGVQTERPLSPPNKKSYLAPENHGRPCFPAQVFVIDLSGSFASLSSRRGDGRKWPWRRQALQMRALWRRILIYARLPRNFTKTPTPPTTRCAALTPSGARPTVLIF